MTEIIDKLIQPRLLEIIVVKIKEKHEIKRMIDGFFTAYQHFVDYL